MLLHVDDLSLFPHTNESVMLYMFCITTMLSLLSNSRSSDQAAVLYVMWLCGRAIVIFATPHLIELPLFACLSKEAATLCIGRTNPFFANADCDSMVALGLNIQPRHHPLEIRTIHIPHDISATLVLRLLVHFLL